MNFTTIPRQLIYRERRTLEEFNIHQENSLNATLYWLLTEILNDKLGLNTYEHMILTMMNEAYYLCTILIMDKQADNHFREYIEAVMPDAPWPEGITTICRRLVYAMSYVCLEKPAAKLDEVRTVRKHLRNCSYEYIARMTYTPTNARHPGLGEFRPVPLTENLLATIDWEETTMFFDTEAVEDILLSLGCNDHEKRLLVEAIYASLVNCNDMSKVDYRTDGLLIKQYKAYGGSYEELMRQGNRVIEQKWHEEQLAAQTTAYEREVARLQKRIKELEQHATRQETTAAGTGHCNTGLTFKLTEIVDYCKNCVDWGDVKDILNMLVTIAGSRATSEERQLIDSIKLHFAGKKQVPVVVEKADQVNAIVGDNTTIQK